MTALISSYVGSLKSNSLVGASGLIRSVFFCKVSVFIWVFKMIMEKGVNFSWSTFQITVSLFLHSPTFSRIFFFWFFGKTCFCLYCLNLSRYLFIPPSFINIFLFNFSLCTVRPVVFSSFTGDWAKTSLLKSPGLFSVFWSTSSNIIIIIIIIIIR